MQSFPLAWAGAASLALVQGLLLATTAWDKSDTIDEAIYLATGARQLERLSVAENCDLPALPRWAYGVALRVVDPALLDPATRGGRHPLWSRDNPRLRRNLMAARATTILATVAAGVFLWSAARRFGDPVGAVAHALWVFSPNVLAHGSLATVDGWATAMVCVRPVGDRAPGRAADARRGSARRRHARAGRRAARSRRWRARPSSSASRPGARGRRPAAQRGAARAARRGARPRSRRPALLVTLSALYVFRWSTVEHGVALPGVRLACRGTCRAGAVRAWFEGLLTQWRAARGGPPQLPLRRGAQHGWWWFYLAALALKTTIGAQALALASPGRVAQVAACRAGC